MKKPKKQKPTPVADANVSKLPLWLQLLLANRVFRITLAVMLYIAAMLMPLLSIQVNPEDSGQYNLRLLGGAAFIGALFPMALFGLSQLVPQWRQRGVRLWVFIVVCLIAIYAGLMRFIF